MGKNDVEHETRIESSTERASHGSQGGYRGSPEMRTDAIRHHYVWDRGIPLGAIYPTPATASARSGMQAPSSMGGFEICGSIRSLLMSTMSLAVTQVTREYVTEPVQDATTDESIRRRYRAPVAPRGATSNFETRGWALVFQVTGANWVGHSSMLPLPTDSPLPLHVMDRLIRHAVSVAEDPVNILLYFFTVAIRELYHSPVIITRPDSFFEHGGLAPPPGFRNTSTEDLIGGGYFKYAALRSVRHLSIVDPATLASVDRYSSYNFPPFPPMIPPMIESVNMPAYNITAPVREACCTLRTLPSGVMPHLDTVRLVIHPDPTWYRQHYRHPLEQLCRTLLKRTEARAWCQNITTLPNLTHWIGFTAGVRHPPFVPPVLHLHTGLSTPDPDEYLKAVTGGTTFIHLDSEGRGTPETPTVQELSIRFRKIGRDIGHCFVVRTYKLSSAERRDVMTRTRITISGPLPWSAESLDSSQISQQMQTALIGGMVEDSVNPDHHRQLERRLSVEVVLGSEGEACPEVEKAIGVASASGNVLNVRNISLIGNPDRSRAGLGTQILGSTDCTDF
ncbi:uncharacterized protein MKK02DRAFT_28184 [Dioszegia hungarica]|uniref:Uncharacterized protein n=1 Tax=Dioszegia hungarica TaxID=4972 RepID=A0AA38H4R4_9TREE|nr:uncharacterized protein MKK02DRAFT_28184 [Dioszegia hungarica]KAI9634442.1 hypothetical protein MKK02DRAFT_28184 [Dioszegia hungarica]